MNGYYRLVIEQLKAKGYWYLRQGKGSHEVWTNGKRNQIVPRNCDVKFTANGIMKQAGINHKF
ncbi:MAG: type II toxin-antitoxin system HicA family toxin [Burkholderiaceae bacterium]